MTIDKGCLIIFVLKCLRVPTAELMLSEEKKTRYVHFFFLFRIVRKMALRILCTKQSRVTYKN